MLLSEMFFIAKFPTSLFLTSLPLIAATSTIVKPSAAQCPSTEY
jgi:hypothetical protein